jgi:hypothetical protein
MIEDSPLNDLSTLLMDYMSGKHTAAMITLTALDPRRLTFVHDFAHWLDAVTQQERLDRIRALQQALDREATV